VAGSLSQIDEVRSGGSYISQSDLRIHFGLGERTSIDLIEIRWPSGAIDQLRNVAVDQFIRVQEGGKLTTLHPAT
ncbi:MAG: ASPIC/UnbV domain-containing protein, partial [Terracidiphilus sp.]